MGLTFIGGSGGAGGGSGPTLEELSTTFARLNSQGDLAINGDTVIDLPVAATYLRGVNTQGGAGSIDDGNAVPGTLGVNYFFPSQTYLNWLASRGHTIIRLDFLWERVINGLNGPVRTTGMNELKACVQRAANAGLKVLLDMKNYGKFWVNSTTRVKFGDGIDVAWFADAWSKIALEFKDQPAVIGWGLMNEPYDLPVAPSGSGSGPPVANSTWKIFSQAATDAIRATGDTRDVYIAGDQFGGAWGWTNINGDPWINDPADAVVYEAHIYFDNNRSGQYTLTYAQEQAADTNGGWLSLPTRVKVDVNNFLSWLDTHGVRGFIGEIGWPSDTDPAEWNAVAATVYDMLNKAGVGATYWSAGEFSSGTAPGERYELDLYDRANLVPQTQATVVEAPRNLSHPGPTVAAQALETAPKVRPIGVWDFASAPTVLGQSIGGGSTPEYTVATGRNWTPTTATTGTAVLGTTGTQGTAVLAPFRFPAAMSLGEVNVEVTTAGSTGAILRAALIPIDANGQPDFSLLIDCGNTTATTTGIKSIVLASPVTLLPKTYWFALAALGSSTTIPTVRTVPVGYGSPVAHPPGLGANTTNIQVWNVGGVTNTTWPTNIALGQGSILMAPPKFWLKAA